MSLRKKWGARVRLDKFLKVSRLIKRRAVAKEVTEGGHVQINGRAAKPSTPVAPGDELCLTLPREVLVVRIERVVDTVAARDAATLYTVLDRRAAYEPDDGHTLR